MENNIQHKFYLLIVMGFCFTLRAAGQQVFKIRGVISKKLSSERIAQVLISNLKSKDLMMSDELGWFSIKGSIGDTLLFNKTDYTPQKVLITTLGDIPVYMQPVIKLAEVTIQGQTKQQELNDIMKDYNRKGIYYNGKPPIQSLILNPLNDLYLLFGKTAKQYRRFEAFSKGELEYTEVRRRYNPAFVKRITHTSDSTAINFMRYYTPSFQDLKGWNDYELIKHVNKAYEFFDKSDNKKKLENLNTPYFLKPGNQNP